MLVMLKLPSLLIFKTLSRQHVALIEHEDFSNSNVSSCYLLPPPLLSPTAADAASSAWHNSNNRVAR